MHKAIFIVLLLILLVLAPWLIPVLVSLFAVYGFIFIAALTAAVVVIPLIFVFLWMAPRPKTASERLAEKNAAFNRRYLEEAEQAGMGKQLFGSAGSNTDKLHAVLDESVKLEISGESIVTDEVECSRCMKVFSLKHLVCPHCGKAPLPLQQ